MRTLSQVALVFLTAACGGGAQMRVTLDLPLSPATCASLQEPALGGSPIDGLLVNVTVRALVPSVELRRDHPCARPGIDDARAFELAVSVPKGENRRLSVALVGPPLSELTNTLAPGDLDGLAASVASERVLFFAGEASVPAEATKSGILALDVRPFVQLFGVARDERGPIAGATATYFSPAKACVSNGAPVADESIAEISRTTTSADGRFFLKVPYQPTDGSCAGRTHGHEGFVFVESGDGRVALLVPGRAEEPGRGLEPGKTLRSSLAIARTPRPQGAGEPLLTGLAHVPEASGLVLYLSGFGLLRALPLQLVLVRADDGTRTPVELRLVASADPFGPFAAYAPFRRFGTSLPFVIRGEVMVNGVHITPPPGAYVVVATQEGQSIELPIAVGPAGR
jgi:hypothetical protein